MRILINDANILIDLIKLDWTSAFFELPLELCTTDFVLEELEDSQRILYQSHPLLVLKSSVALISDMTQLMEQQPGLSFEDCSVWVHAKIAKGILVTGDAKLRKLASSDGIEVRGIIFLIELIKNQDIRSISECVSILEKLKVINPRLPIHELESRIENWRRELS
jgi:predicted nucleic acid-binding protein